MKRKYYYGRATHSFLSIKFLLFQLSNEYKATQIHMHGKNFFVYRKLSTDE